MPGGARCCRRVLYTWSLVLPRLRPRPVPWRGCLQKAIGFPFEYASLSNQAHSRLTVLAKQSQERENVGLLHRENVGLDQNTAKGLYQNIAERLCDTTGCVDEYEVKVTSEPHHHASRRTKKLSERLISALPSQLASHSQRDVGLYLKRERWV